MNVFQQSHPYESSFPFILMYKETRDSSMEPDFHFHNGYEIVFAHSGKGNFFIQHSFYEIKPGDVYTIPGNVIHRATTTRTTPYTVSVIIFQPELIHPSIMGEDFPFLESFDPNKNGGTYQQCISSLQTLKLEQQLFDLNQELSLKQEGYKHQVIHLFHQLLIDVVRYKRATISDTLPKEPKSHIWMKEILSYIDAHLSKDLSLSHLAKQGLVSPAHFSRVFKKMTGFNIPDYINVNRVLKSKGLLVHSNLPITLIAEQCGFESVSHFHRTFKKHAGFTPGFFRNN
jgi:AraC-like DNA-binding protein